MGTTTTKLGLYKPANGETGWGSSINANADTLDAAVLDQRDGSKLTAKTTPVDADSVVMVDSAASNAVKRTTWANIKTALQSALAFISTSALVTSVGSPGSDSNVPSEKAVRTAIAAAGDGQARWTEITDFNDTAPAASGLLFSAEFSDLEEWQSAALGIPWIPLRWKCAGDTAYRYGAILAVSPKSTFTASGHTGTAQAGTSTSITLASGASASDDAYNGLWLIITGGTGAGQYRQIANYTGSTKVVELGGTPLTVTPDATSTYALVHMVVYGCPFATGANAVEEVWYGRRDMLFNICALVPGVYSDQAEDTKLFSTLVGGIIPYDRPQSAVIGFSVWHKKADTGTQPKINIAVQGMDASTNDTGDGVQAPASVAAGSTGGERVFNPLGECATALTLMATGGSIEPDASGHAGALEIILKAPGGNGDAEDLTVNAICVEV